MSHEGKKSPWVTMAVFEDLDTARTLENFLRGHGLESRTFNDKLLQLFLFLCPPRVTFRVQARQHEFQRATGLMDTDRNAGTILRRAIHCPECGSLRISYPQMTRKFLLPTLLLHLGIIFRVIEHEAYCEFCHHTWNLPKLKAQSPSSAHATG
ncbi:MAG TPA: hypothetical protein VFV81_06250 [Verrucomicrobiae bacterium]|nr:hypothetical protein [Verrucomicrobiae bacterium]